MKIIIVRDTYISGSPVFKGERVTAEEPSAKVLLQLNHAVEFTPENDKANPERKK